MDLKSILIFVASLLNIILGFFILRKNYKNSSNISYFFLCFFGGLWGIVKTFQITTADIYLQDLIITKLIYFFGMLAPFAYLLFSYNFPYKIRKYPKAIAYSVYSLPLFLIFLVLINILKMSKVQLIDNNLHFDVIFIDFLIFALYYFIYVFMGLIILLKKFNKMQGVYKIQIKYLIIATIISFTSIGFVSVLLLLFNNFKYDWLGPIFMLINFFVVGYYLFYKVNRV